jgi:hypothetical protein
MLDTHIRREPHACRLNARPKPNIEGNIVSKLQSKFKIIIGIDSTIFPATRSKDGRNLPGRNQLQFRHRQRSTSTVHLRHTTLRQAELLRLAGGGPTAHRFQFQIAVMLVFRKSRSILFRPNGDPDSVQDLRNKVSPERATLTIAEAHPGRDIRISGLPEPPLDRKLTNFTMINTQAHTITPIL